MTKKEYNKALSSYPEALTASETAEILRVCTKTIYKMIRLGEIPSVKIGREIRISKRELVSYLRNKEKVHTNPNCVCSDNSAGTVWTSDRSCGSVGGAGTKDGRKEKSA